MKFLFLRVGRADKQGGFAGQAHAHAALAGDNRLGQGQVPAGQVRDALDQFLRRQFPLVGQGVLGKAPAFVGDAGCVGSSTGGVVTLLEGSCEGSPPWGGAGWLQPASATQRASAKRISTFFNYFPPELQ